METTERTAAPARRRVGTFTLGIVLVVSGCCMLAGWFFPFHPVWVLKASPLILISLGVETLLAARSGSRLQYDWVGMLLTFLLVCGAAGMYAVTWFIDVRQDALDTYSSTAVMEERFCRGSGSLCEAQSPSCEPESNPSATLLS